MGDGEDTPTDELPTKLGEKTTVDGAPVARVAARLTWPQKASRIREKEGDTTVRTPEGPRRLGDLLDEVNVTYFDRRQTFLEAVRDTVGDAPVPTD